MPKKKKNLRVELTPLKVGIDELNANKMYTLHSLLNYSPGKKKVNIDILAKTGLQHLGLLYYIQYAEYFFFYFKRYNDFTQH